MAGHHLILGRLTDFLTGEALDDTLDERYRQEMARRLVSEKGFRKSDLIPRKEIIASAGENRARIKVDLAVAPGGRVAMIAVFGPGSLVTRRRPALAASRVLARRRIPLVVVFNGKDAETLDGETGEVLGRGLGSIPVRRAVLDAAAGRPRAPLPERHLELESRILYAYEVDGSCPCDDTICRL